MVRRGVLARAPRSRGGGVSHQQHRPPTVQWFEIKVCRAVVCTMLVANMISSADFARREPFTGVRI